MCREECSHCTVGLNECMHSRRCFMSGEYCSKQANIQRERERLHGNKEINAFVIMNFSNMSDVVYNWRIKPFIESLKKYLLISNDRIICSSKSQLSQNGTRDTTTTPTSEKATSPNDGTETDEVLKINVIRADSNYASNYVVCNRVCQQMQIADLIVVDVSSENTNVFYEFGMAVAFGKLILPICYSESFYGMHIPEELIEYEKKAKEKNLKKDIDFDTIRRHIDCYPWRRTLFEYFGIRYRSEKDSESLWKNPYDLKQITHYEDYSVVTNPDYGFSDVQYKRFPYTEKLDNSGNAIGQKIYENIASSYNKARYIHNTVIVYTLDGFLNEVQAGECIVNYYKAITSKLKEEHCFCGDRVGILIQPNTIPEGVKDSKMEKHLLYNVGEIIHIGMNEATYIAQKEKIKPKDFLCVPDIAPAFADNCILSRSAESEEDSIPCDSRQIEKPQKVNDKASWIDDTLVFVKNHIRNRSVSIYPNSPVYVSRVQSGLQKDILDVPTDLESYFCFYHIMLRTLKYCNEIVVDISKNPLQSLFWLGAAHGSSVNAITVQHEESDHERVILTGSAAKRERAIFDVAGLWTAILRSNDTEGFYKQLSLAQQGIEQHSKLMLRNLAYYEQQMIDYLYSDISEQNNKNLNEGSIEGRISDLFKEKKIKEEQALESYYRDRFWKPMLRYEHLRIYLAQSDRIDSTTQELSQNAVTWDVNAISQLSYYLSKRKHIGDYSLRTLGRGKTDPEAVNSNFIAVGNNARPLEGNSQCSKALAEHVQTQDKICSADVQTGENVVHTQVQVTIGSPEKAEKNLDRRYKGFAYHQNGKHHCMFTQIPHRGCFECIRDKKCKSQKENQIIFIRGQDTNLDAGFQCPVSKERACSLYNEKYVHTQLAQLVLWRERDETQKIVRFWVSLNGVSGPATLALSTLFVNEIQRESVFGLEKGSLIPTSAENEEKGLCDEMKTPLSILQNTIREKFTTHYIETLREQLKFDDTSLDSTKKIEFSKIVHQTIYAAALYLSSTLYRFFLPLLSFEDEETLINGMNYFLSSMLASDLVHVPEEKNNRVDDEKEKEDGLTKDELISKTVDTLRSTLKSFRGIEAIYEVEVEISESTTSDSRKCRGMKPLKLDGCAPVNCIYLN